MATTIGGIKVKIGADTSGFESGLKKTRTGLNQVGKWGAAAAAAAVVGAAAIVNSQRKVLDSLAKTSDALGIQQEKLQALQHIGELTGTSNEMVNKSLERMQKNLGNAARMGGASADALADIGVNVKDIINLAPDKQMEQLASAISGVDNQALKASISNDLFGRSGVRMLKMMEQLKDEGLDPTVEALDKMGVSLSRIETSKVENANDALFKAEEVVTGLANKLTVKLSPIIEAIANQFIDAAIESEGFAGTIDTAFNGALAVVGLFADGLHGVSLIFKTLEVAAIGFASLAVNVFQGVTSVIAMAIEGWVLIVNDAIGSINNVFDTGISEIPSVRGSKFVTGVVEIADNMIGLVETTNAELQAMAMQELPSEQLKKFVEEVEIAATQASKALVGVMGGGTDGETKSAPDKDGIANAQKAIEDLMLLNETKLEEIIRFEEEKKLLIDTLLADELITKAEHQAALTEIEQNGADSRVELTEAEAAMKKAATMGFFSDLSSLMNSGSKKAFKIGKAAALAQAGIKGVESAISAWSAGMSVGGPWAPLVAAGYTAASLAKTGTMIQSIKSQSFGAPSSPTSFSGGLPSVNTGGAGGAGPTNNISVDIVGSENATFSRDSVIGLIGQINGAVSDGVTLNTGG